MWNPEEYNSTTFEPSKFDLENSMDKNPKAGGAVPQRRGNRRAAEQHDDVQMERRGP